MEVVVPLKYLSNFWRSLDLPLINCQIGIDLSWSEECIVSEISITPEIAGNPNARPPVQVREAIQTSGALFQTNSAKLDVPVVMLSINDNTTLLENIKQGFKRTISWNKYRSKSNNTTHNNNLRYLIDPTFRNINRLFVLSFENGNNGPTRRFFDKYDMPLVAIKDFDVLIEYKAFLISQ